jgi:hypothetical protein
MGMSSDNHEPQDLTEPVVKTDEKEPAKPTYTIVRCIMLDGVPHQLLVGEDHKWYKAKKIGECRRDKKNRTPLVPMFGDIEPFNEEDKKYFQ